MSVERKLDSLGRVVIPKEFRDVLGWPTGVRVNMQVSGDKVIISKSESCCAMCGSVVDLKDIKGIRICQNCVDEIKVGTFWDVD